MYGRKAFPSARTEHCRQCAIGADALSAARCGACDVVKNRHARRDAKGVVPYDTPPIMLIGAKKDQIATAASLGLRKIGDTVSQPDNAATKGKVAKIIHLIETTEA